MPHMNCHRLWLLFFQSLHGAFLERFPTIPSGDKCSVLDKLLNLPERFPVRLAHALTTDVQLVVSGVGMVPKFTALLHLVAPSAPLLVAAHSRRNCCITHCSSSLSSLPPSSAVSLALPRMSSQASVMPSSDLSSSVAAVVATLLLLSRAAPRHRAAVPPPARREPAAGTAKPPSRCTGRLKYNLWLLPFTYLGA